MKKQAVLVFALVMFFSLSMAAYAAKPQAGLKPIGIRFTTLKSRAGPLRLRCGIPQAKPGKSRSTTTTRRPAPPILTRRRTNPRRPTR